MQLGDHRAALRTLALTLGDIRLAEAYCARFTGHDGHLMLLDLLLHPGDERPPLYIEACHLLAAQGRQQSKLSTCLRYVEAGAFTWALAVRWQVGDAAFMEHGARRQDPTLLM